MSVPDVQIKAKIKDETGDGAAQVARNMEKFFGKSAAKGMDGASKHIQDAWHRVMSDQKTTGLDPLGRAFSQIIGDKLGATMAIGGVAVIGSQFEQATAKAVELRHQLDAGQLDTKGMVHELAAGIPILGSFIGGFDNVREAITGEKAGLEMSNQLLEARLQTMDAVYSKTLALKNLEKDWAEQNRHANAELGMVGLRGSSKDFAGIHEAGNQQRADADRMAREAQLAAETDPELKAAQAKLEEIRRKHQGEASEHDQLVGARKYDILGEGFVKDRQKAIKDKFSDLHQAEAEVARLNDVVLKKKNESLAESGTKRKEADDMERAQTAEARKLYGERATLMEAETAAEAKRLESSKEYQIQQAKIAAQQEYNQTTDAGERVRIMNKMNAQIANINKEAGIEQYRLEQSAGQARADAKAEAQANILRQDGHGYDAERLLRQRELDKRKADIDAAANIEIARNKDNASAIAAKAQADKAALDAKFQDSERQAGRERSQGEFGVQKELMDIRIGTLQQEAKFGNIAAAVEAKRLSITEQFAEKRQELNQLITDPHVDKAQKDAARQSLGVLDAQEKQALMFANFTGGIITPDLVTNARGSGAAARAREENSPFIQMLRIQQQHLKETQEMNKKIEKNTQAVEANTKQGVALAGVP